MAARINTSKLKLIDCYTKLRRRRERRKNYLKIVGEHFAKAAKTLVVSELIAIFYPRDEKS